MHKKSTIRRLLGDSLVNQLKSFDFLYSWYSWYRQNIHARLLSTSPDKAYENWILNQEPKLWLPTNDINQQALISIIVPVYNPPLKYFKACIESVLKQSYSNWELILVDDASTNEDVTSYLTSLSNIDSRIIVKCLEKNQHICGATNAGIDIATGKYVTFLDHDDLLSHYALNEISMGFQNNPNWQWIYSDEDFISLKGKRCSPHFKSDWNLFLLRSHNYITHFCAYEINLLRELGGCRKGVEGAQDYDLALRASTVLNVDQIGHISKILYHWRVHPNSTSMSSNAKSYTVDAGRKALEEHLAEHEILATVNDAEIDNFYHVHYQAKHTPKASILIPTRDQFGLLSACVDSILNKTSYDNFEIIIVDNQSTCNDTINYLNQMSCHEKVKVLEYDKEFNYSAINNYAARNSTGDIFVLLNNDTEVISNDWLSDLVGIASQPSVGCVGAKLLYDDLSIQHAGVIMGLGGYAAHSHRGLESEHAGYFNRSHVTQNLSAVTAACLAITKEAYWSVNGLDEAFEVAYNDVDFCLRVNKKGFQNIYCATAVLYHYESKSRGLDISIEKQLRFEREKALLLSRWPEVIDSDPFYSPHLTRSAENFTIRKDY